jgi:hypothetical protein
VHRDLPHVSLPAGGEIGVHHRGIASAHEPHQRAHLMRDGDLLEADVVGELSHPKLVIRVAVGMHEHDGRRAYPGIEAALVAPATSEVQGSVPPRGQRRSLPLSPARKQLRGRMCRAKISGRFWPSAGVAKAVVMTSTVLLRAQARGAHRRTHLNRFDLAVGSRASAGRLRIRIPCKPRQNNARMVEQPVHEQPAVGRHPMSVKVHRGRSKTASANQRSWETGH